MSRPSRTIRDARRVLRQLLEGVAELGTGRDQWPYGAILPWAESRSMWHAWSSQMAGALARGSVVLDRPALLRPAVREAVSFDTTLIAAGGPDNGWFPTPADRVQIAYGIDSRVQNLLTTADAAHLPGLRSLAAMHASWFFGANRSGVPMYDPATGVTFDGLQPDGSVNHNSGAESTIHGLLTMLALDAHPQVAAQATAWRDTPEHSGLVSTEAESASPTSGTVITPESAWTGESLYGGGAFLRLQPGERARIDLGPATQARVLEPVAWQAEGGKATSRWTVGSRSDQLRHRVGAQGITVVSGALLPQRLRPRLPATETAVTVRAVRGTVDLDAVISRPIVSASSYGTGSDRTWMLASIAAKATTYRVAVGAPKLARSYDAQGRLVRQSRVAGSADVWLAPGGFAVIGAG